MSKFWIFWHKSLGYNKLKTGEVLSTSVTCFFRPFFTIFLILKANRRFQYPNPTIFDQNRLKFTKMQIFWQNMMRNPISKRSPILLFRPHTRIARKAKTLYNSMWRIAQNNSEEMNQKLPYYSQLPSTQWLTSGRNLKKLTWFIHTFFHTNVCYPCRS